MQGKTVVITGATSGIGEVAALALAGQGARIVFIARTQARAEQTLARLRAVAPGAAHGFHLADLSRLAQMRQVASAIATAEPQIHVLLNNAGAYFAERRETPDGLEMTLAVNHLAYFVITAGLLDRLKATPAARIVSTSSSAHEGAHLDFDDLQMRRGYRGLGAYGRSKLMNILFTRELAKRLSLAGSAVTSNCHHPGFVSTRFGDVDNHGLMAVVFRVAKRFALSSERGAATMIYLAASPEVQGISGQYFYQCNPAPISKAAQSDADARRLWEISEQLATATG